MMDHNGSQWPFMLFNNCCFVNHMFHIFQMVATKPSSKKLASLALVLQLVVASKASNDCESCLPMINGG